MTDISVTEVRNALRCARLFALGRHFSKRVVFPVGASALGAAFHRIAERFAASTSADDARLVTLPPSAPSDEICDAISGVLLAQLVAELDRNAAYASMPAEVDDLAEALRAFASYLAQRISRRSGPNVGELLSRFLHDSEVRVECELATPSGVARLSGRIDAIHSPEEHEYEVVEYKLTDESVAELDRAQVALYRRMLIADRRAVPLILRFGPGLVVTRLEPSEADGWVEQTLVPLVGGMIEWTARPERAPATQRSDLCPACPLRRECAEFYADRLPVRDDPPAGAFRPRPRPDGELTLDDEEVRATPAGPAALSGDGVDEAQRLAALVVRLYADQGVAAAIRKPARVGARLVRLELTANRGSISRLDRAHEDVIHHLAAEHGISASYVREGALRTLLAQRLEPRTVRLAPLLAENRVWLGERAGRFVLGETAEGGAQRVDLSEPTSCHLLIGGTTGSGKSVLLKGIAAGLVQFQPPSAVQLVLVDPKRVTFAPLAASLGAHLARPVCFDANESVAILHDLVTEMEQRYLKFAERQVESIDEHNAAGLETLPRQVVIIDEFQDLLANRDTKEPFLAAVQRLGAKARAAGIHLVLATQHPDRKTVPAAIKVNMTGKIALKVHQGTDSLVVLGARGAEKLLGNGDLYADLGRGIVRVHAALP